MTGPRPLAPGTSGELGPVLESVFAELRSIRELLEDRRKPWLTVDEVARIVGRDSYTVRSWVKAGKLTHEDAYRHLAAMAAIIDSLKTLERLEVEQRQLSLFRVS